MFYSAELLSKRSPLGAVWLLAHGKKLSKVKIMSVNVSETCEKILDPEVPHALRLQAILIGGIVVIHSKQQLYLYEDVTHVMRQAALGYGPGEEATAAGSAALLPAEGGGGAGAGGAAAAAPASAASADFAALGGLGGLGPHALGGAQAARGIGSRGINLAEGDALGGGLGLIDLGAGTQSLLAQLNELNGVGVVVGGIGTGATPGGGDEDLFVVDAADASAFGGGASMSRGGGGGRSATAAAAAAARMLGYGAVARFRGFEADGGGELPLLGGAGRGGSQQQQEEGGGRTAAAAAAAGDRLPAVPDDLMNELDYYNNQGMEGFGGGDGMMHIDGGEEQQQQQQQQQQFPEEEVVVGGARLAPGSEAPRKLRRVARPAIDPEAAGLLPSAVIRSWIQDASPTLVPGGRGGAVAAAAAAAASSSSSSFEFLLPSAASKRKRTAAAAATIRVDELRRRLAPQGPFAGASASAALGPWPAPLQAMLLSRMTVPGVADEPSISARGGKKSRKRGRAAGDAAAPVSPQSPGAAAAAAANAPFDAFAEANAGGENVHDFGFGEFGAGGQQQDEFGGGGGDGWGGGWRLSPADALVAANAGGGDFGANFGGGGGGDGGGDFGGGGAYDGGIERMRAALLASAGRDGGMGGALGRSPGSAGLAAGATPGGAKAASSGDRPSSDADGTTRSGDENANAGEVNRRGGGAGGALGALDEEWAQTQFPAGGSLLEETQEEKEKARRTTFLATASQLPRVEELPVATRAAVQAMRARFAALAAAGRPPRLSLDAAATGSAAAGGRPLGRLDAARLFYQVCACVSAGYVKAAQRAPYGDVLLAPGRAMGDLSGGGGGGGGGGGMEGERSGRAAAAAATSGRVVSARA